MLTNNSDGNEWVNGAEKVDLTKKKKKKEAWGLGGLFIQHTVAQGSVIHYYTGCLP